MSCGRSRRRASPFKVTVPPDRGCVPASAFRKQVLPTPLVPMMQVTSPGFGGKINAVQDLAAAVVQGKALCFQHHPRPR